MIRNEENTIKQMPIKKACSDGRLISFSSYTQKGWLMSKKSIYYFSSFPKLQYQW